MFFVRVKINIFMIISQMLSCDDLEFLRIFSSWASSCYQNAKNEAQSFYEVDNKENFIILASRMHQNAPGLLSIP